MHNGGCLKNQAGNNGWDRCPNSKATSVMECFETCSIRMGKNGLEKRGYFGFKSKEPGTKDSCACFLKNSTCEPGTNPKMDVYRIDWDSAHFTEGTKFLIFLLSLDYLCLYIYCSYDCNSDTSR